MSNQVVFRFASKEGITAVCDARCFHAFRDECHCICAGANHKRGQNNALGNARAHGREWAKAFADKLGIEEYDLEFFYAQPLQLAMFHQESAILYHKPDDDTRALSD